MENAPVTTRIKDQQAKDRPVQDGTGKVDVVVQEYMDSLLGDLFPTIEEPSSSVDEPLTTTETQTESVSTQADESENNTVKVNKAEIVKPIEQPQETVVPIDVPNNQVSEKSTVNPLNLDDVPERQSNVALEESASIAEPISDQKIVLPSSIITEARSAYVEVTSEQVEPLKPSTQLTRDIESNLSVSSHTEPHEILNVPTASVIKPTYEIKQEIKPEIEKRYPKAPDWAQGAFDVLLFDVCGLKLAVPMESLGRIIKVEHETNQLIGRPDWFIGAYNEAEEHLYVVDTAKYIMPEKGYDLEQDGFAFLIQLQKSKWTLACKSIYSTVRVEPDQVKWRSTQGKRQWLSGTVIEHMCALIHVDVLIDLLESGS